MSLKSLAASILGAVVAIAAPTWNLSANADLLALEKLAIDRYGGKLADWCANLLHQVQPGITKLEEVATKLVQVAAADGIKITQDVAILLTQRAYLQIVPTLEADLKKAIADLRAAA